MYLYIYYMYIMYSLKYMNVNISLWSSNKSLEVVKKKFFALRRKKIVSNHLSARKMYRNLL